MCPHHRGWFPHVAQDDGPSEADLLRPDDPGVAVGRREVADMFCNLGVSLCELGQLQPSLAAFGSALRYDQNHARAGQNERAMLQFLR